MTNATVLEQYIDRCHQRVFESDRALRCLAKHGVTERFVIESFRIGYADGSLLDQVGENQELMVRLRTLGLVDGSRELFRNCITIPILNEDRAPVNLIAMSCSANSKHPIRSLSGEGVFNAPFLRNAEEIFLTEHPLHTLFLIQHGIDNATCVSGNDDAVAAFGKKHGIRSVDFTFDGKERLFYELSTAGITARRVSVDFRGLIERPDTDTIRSVLAGTATTEMGESEDTIQQIESGFIFRFSLLSYRVIGSFGELATSMKVSIKAFTTDRVFVDSIDLYKHRDRERFVYNLIDRFDVRDQLRLENDLTRIVEVIEKHKEQRSGEKKRSKPALTDYQRDIGTKFLTNPKMLEEIEKDYTKLGYVQERKNKLLMYLVMTSRLTESPLHAIAVSRSGAGKSHLAEITEQLCPPEDLESVSDLSAQALYYYGQDDLRHTFVVIGEKAGSEGADYPLRELISRKSITKAIPMKDPSSGQIKTVTITVEGPIALVETTTSSEVNAENLNRCFILSIDESEEQTVAIHRWQRTAYTLDGLTQKRTRKAIVEKHVYAQRLLRKVTVVNPFAELLTFPSGSLRSRRDNEKFLRLISSICFLHQYQRPVKNAKLTDSETVEYIECTAEDYRIAYDLLADGVLENTLDDLPRPARRLLEVIHSYLDKRAEAEAAEKERLVFERKDIREFSSWSFAQVRNNIRVLTDYEYLRQVNGKNGTATQYRLAGGANDPDFMAQIVSPEELAKRLRESKTT